MEMVDKNQLDTRQDKPERYKTEEENLIVE